MRVYGRLPVPFPPNGVVSSETMTYGSYRWVVIETEPNGSNGYVYVSALIQCLRLNLQESPFFANFGIPAEIAVRMQLQPDYYVNFIQSFFAQFFASLIIAKAPQVPKNENFVKGGKAFTTPVYNISAIFKNGTTYQTTIGI